MNYGNSVERFKNYMQLLIWAHNRLENQQLRSIAAEAQKALENGLITYHQCETILTAEMIYLEDVELRSKKEVQQACAFGTNV